MGDQHRWFKLWVTAPADDALQELPPALRWAWAAFGAYTKAHGTHGIVTVRPGNAVLAAEMGVAPAELLPTLASLPNLYLGTAPVRWPHGHHKPPVCAGEFVRGSYPPIVWGSDPPKWWGTHNGGITVTWANWNKYQADTTMARRGAASRSKKRRDEKRVVPPPTSPVGESVGASESEGFSTPPFGSAGAPRRALPPDQLQAYLTAVKTRVQNPGTG